MINRVVEEGTLYLSGWGRLSEGGSQPQVLQFLETYPVPLAQCKAEIPANDDTFCAFSKLCSIGLFCPLRFYPLTSPMVSGSSHVILTSFLTSN